ncbi:MAG: hypothetical protein J7647_26570 [Cyanobacteria bacterium SBLK]|nr:hypothetical protein [Cyanobacteria bacterium SBLK]
MLHEFFKQVQTDQKIKNKDLASVVGCSEKHISQFRNGNAEMTASLFWELVEGMEKLAPGSKVKLGVLIIGRLDSEKSAFLLNLIAQNLLLSQSTNETTKKNLLTVS